MLRMPRGHCVQCGHSYEADQIEHALCPACLRFEPQNDPTPIDDELMPQWEFSKAAMRERLGTTGNEDV